MFSVYLMSAKQKNNDYNVKKLKKNQMKRDWQKYFYASRSKMRMSKEEINK